MSVYHRPVLVRQLKIVSGVGMHLLETCLEQVRTGELFSASCLNCSRCFCTSFRYAACPMCAAHVLQLGTRHFEQRGEARREYRQLFGGPQ